MKTLTYTTMAFVALMTVQAFANTSDTSGMMANRYGYKGENPMYSSDVARTGMRRNLDTSRTTGILRRDLDTNKTTGIIRRDVDTNRTDAVRGRPADMYATDAMDNTDTMTR
ncbi:hypothetical protein H0X48_03990 [Candidatus Dependentiae bacterium]|nr:hypothetical protein [Candidatus Dependentiae bacterium]